MAKPPYAEEWLAAEAMSGGRSVLSGSIPEMRTQFRQLFDASKASFPAINPETVTTAHGKTSQGVIVHMYTPANPPANAPTGLYIHSGGWTLGSIEHEEHLARALALDVPCRLISVEYGLAPENPFPAAIEDCVSAWDWIARQSHVQTDNMFIVGGSAGGNLTLATALRLLDIGHPHQPKAIFSICPMVCMPQAYSKLPADLQQFLRPEGFYSDAAAINEETAVICSKAYIGDHDPADPGISPIFHDKLGGLPPVYLTTSDKDPLNCDAEMMEYKLKRLGVDVELKEYKGYPHFFHVLPLKATQRFNDDLAAAIRKRCMKA